MVTMTPADRDRVTTAVTAAETATDAEIVTVVAPQSDAYHDVALHYAVAAMLAVAGAAAGWPGWVGQIVAWSGGGWSAEGELSRHFLVLMLAMTLAFLLVRYLADWSPLRRALTPRAVRSRRVRRRAIQYFKVGAESRTTQRVGVLLLLSLDERLAEIVVDEAILARVAPERWGEAMAALIDGVRAGQAADGMAAAIGLIGGVLAQHFPKTASDPNELPDRLILL